MVAGTLEQLQLLEQQDMDLVSKKELLADRSRAPSSALIVPLTPGIFNSVVPPLGPRGLTASGSWLGDFVPVGCRNTWNGGALYPRVRHRHGAVAALVPPSSG